MSTDPATHDPSQAARPTGLSYLERALRWLLLSVFVLVPIGLGIKVIVTGRLGLSVNQEPLELSPVVAWLTGTAMMALGLLFVYIVLRAMRLKSAGQLVSGTPPSQFARWLTAGIVVGLLVVLAYLREWGLIAAELMFAFCWVILAVRMHRNPKRDIVDSTAGQGASANRPRE
jgi:hypothetical protein